MPLTTWHLAAPVDALHSSVAQAAAATVRYRPRHQSSTRIDAPRACLLTLGAEM